MVLVIVLLLWLYSQVLALVWSCGMDAGVSAGVSMSWVLVYAENTPQVRALVVWPLVCVPVRAIVKPTWGPFLCSTM